MDPKHTQDVVQMTRLIITHARTHTPQEDMEMFIVYIMRLSVGNKVAPQTGPGMAWERAGVWGFVIVR